MMIVITSVCVAFVCFIIYALERKSKNEDIDWLSAIKISLFGGLITAGVVFAVEPKDIEEIVSVAAVVPDETKDMFVGVPTF